MEDKITIIEGPPPTFELAPDAWVLGLNEGPSQAAMVMTRLRTFNGPALVERCYNAWRNNKTIRLEYRLPDGLQQETPIVAARSVEVEEGQMLILWLRIPAEDAELEIGFDDNNEENE
jgi:hypothetical protein